MLISLLLTNKGYYQFFGTAISSVNKLQCQQVLKEVDVSKFELTLKKHRLYGFFLLCITYQSNV